MADSTTDWNALAAEVTANFLTTGRWFAGPAAAPAPDADWNALAAQATANFLATGYWFLGGAQAPAPAFRYLNDPSSTVDTRAVAVSVAGDTVVETGGLAVNLTDQPLPDLALLVPYAWPRLADAPDGSTVRVPLAWDDRQHGWFTSDFAGTGTSLLLTLRIVAPDGAPDGRVAAGSVADDPSLTVPIALSSDTLVPFPEETLRPGDELPFADLGGIGPGEAKPFDLVFTYSWGAGAHGEAVRVNFFAYTISPVSAPDAAALL